MSDCLSICLSVSVTRRYYDKTVKHIVTLFHHQLATPSSFFHTKRYAAFDSVDCTALWQLLLSIGLPHRIVELFKALYTDTVSCVRADGCESEWFPVNSGVRQAVLLLPIRFWSQWTGS